MSVLVLQILAVVVAYLIGAIPFGLLIARWVGGVDIRTVGSGNIGATNVGRVLGFRFFVLVFLLDMLKGLLPTLGLPAALDRLAGANAGYVPVLVALATILGHSFPVYLGFRGGKGVATSFGALLALDPVATLGAGVAFLIFLLVVRYVSLSSVLAGFVFALVHFLRVPEPWSDQEAPMSLLIFALLILLTVRHRHNFARIRAGTEPKVSLRRKPSPPPAGRIALVLLVVIAVLALVAGGVAWITHRPVLFCETFTLTPVARMATGHQRAERLAFGGGGEWLAVTCPRYNRVVVARVVTNETLEKAVDIALEGRPVALWPQGERIYILERPIADAHHVEAGWLEVFDLEGRRLGSRFRVGFDPDDLVISADGRMAFVLTSGHAEGESNRPDPALLVIDLGPSGIEPNPIAQLVFDQPRDDPERVALDPGGRHAAVSLQGSNAIAWVDLADLDRPHFLGRTPLKAPGALTFGADGALFVTSTEDPGIWVIASDGTPPRALPVAGSGADVVVLPSEDGDLACTLPQRSGLEVVNPRSSRSRGRLPLLGQANLVPTRPLGLALCPERGLLAVANRQGGSVHLIALKHPDERPQGAVASTRGSDTSSHR
jgi:acyl-phosphate glycerol 3-phosphate acyltransferase